MARYDPDRSPQLGRVVIYHDAGDDYPAIVVSYHDEDSTVKLFVMGFNTNRYVYAFKGTKPGQWSWPKRSEYIPERPDPERIG